MRRVESYLISVDIPTPVDQQAAEQGSPSLPVLAANKKAALKEAVDLLSPFNQDCKRAMPDYVQPVSVSVDTNNPIFPFTIDPEMVAQQDTLPFDQMLQQQSSYNGNINSALAPLAGLDNGLGDSENWALDQSIADQVLKFSKNPPKIPGLDLDFWNYLTKLDSAHDKLSEAISTHRDALKDAVNGSKDAYDALALSDMNSRASLGAYTKYKSTVKDFFLDGKMPSLPWVTPSAPAIPRPNINISLPSLTIPSLPR